MTEATLTDAVLARLTECHDPRLRQVLNALIRHAHAFIGEIGLTEAEWARGIEFLTETGRICTERRQEFILLSDILGISMLVDALSHLPSPGATETTVLGPFYVEGAPLLPLGSDIAGSIPGEPTLVSGRVLDTDAKPVGGALLDVWQAGSDGFYSNQRPDLPIHALRGRFRSDPEGRYHFRTIKPVSYPVPTDGPVGRILDGMGRHPYRPAHLHFIVSAPGYETLGTHLFVAGDPYLDSDAVFGVKPSLIVEFKPGPDGSGLEARYDFGLKRAAAG